MPGAQPIRLSEIDRPTLGIYIALSVIGWLMIYAANYNPDVPYGFFDLTHNAGKQLLFMILCGAMIFVIMMTDWSFWRTFAIGIYIFALLLLPGTLIFGREINGANAWYQIGGFSFQPAEIAKFATCLAMAAYLSSSGLNLKNLGARLTAFAIFLLPAAIVLIQKDTGSALVFFSFMLVLYREGLSPVWYTLGFGTAAMVILGLIFEPPYIAAALLIFYNFQLIRRLREPSRFWWVAWAVLLFLSIGWSDVFQWTIAKAGLTPDTLPGALSLLPVPHLFLTIVLFFRNYLRKNAIIQREMTLGAVVFALAGGLAYMANFACYTLLAPHQQQRIKIWLKPAEAQADARGAAYNLLHSKMAIGSGGFLGKGYLNGNMTNLNYVPEQATDFIFCTIGEEQGFVGVVAIISLFFWLLYRIIQIAERQRSNFSRVYAYSVAGIIFMHVLVNLGMTMGLLPIIGIPLPFISSGGSSMIGFSLMIAVLLKLDSNRNLA